MKRAITVRDNFIWLLIALIFLYFIDAVFTQLGWEQGQRLVNLSLLVTIIVGIWSLEENQGRWLNLKIGMSLIIALIMVSDSIIESNFLARYQLVVSLLFLSLTLFLAWQQVMFRGMVDTNKIIGAICIYILMGLIWALAYLLVEQVFPGSFDGLEGDLWQTNMEEMVYYSMVTLTTLGYGDITPVQPLARFLGYMQAVTGVFYTTVLVASLIGMRLAEHSAHQQPTASGQ